MTRDRSADHQRFDRIYADNLPLILGYAYRRCPEPGGAADVAAEVFLTAWRRLGDVPEGEERLWLFGVARRVLANHRRGQLRRSRLADRLRDELAVRPRATMPDENVEIVRSAMDQLPEGDRELLRLAVWDGLTPSEIAVLEGISAVTVRSRLLRARTRLRAILVGLLAEPQSGPVAGPTPSTNSTSWS
jgi:RNA polymerase sigma factor (sigma-70 family)